MVTVLEECAIEEQRSVVRFLWAKGLNVRNIYEEMCPVYGGKCLSRKAVHNWVEKFSQDIRISQTMPIRCGSGSENNQKTSMLRASTSW
jgi:hypothetical protein